MNSFTKYSTTCISFPVKSITFFKFYFDSSSGKKKDNWNNVVKHTVKKVCKVCYGCVNLGLAIVSNSAVNAVHLHNSRVSFNVKISRKVLFKVIDVDTVGFDDISRLLYSRKGNLSVTPSCFKCYRWLFLNQIGISENGRRIHICMYM